MPQRLTFPPRPVRSIAMRPKRVLWPLLVALLAPSAAHAAPADPYVVYTANNYATGAVVLRTDPAAGSLVEISRNGPQGTLFERPFDLALEADGDILVADMGSPCLVSRCDNDGRIIRVDPITGRQTLLASGAPLLDPAGIAVAPNGSIYVADNYAADDDGAVIRVDPRERRADAGDRGRAPRPAVRDPGRPGRQPRGEQPHGARQRLLRRARPLGAGAARRRTADSVRGRSVPLSARGGARRPEPDRVRQRVRAERACCGSRAGS